MISNYKLYVDDLKVAYEDKKRINFRVQYL